MNKYLIVIILLFGFKPTFSQVVFFEDYIEPESDFTELKNKLRNGDSQLKQIEIAFLNWDFRKLIPFLHEELKSDVKIFFQTNKVAMKKYEWKKRTHYGPSIGYSFDGNYGLTNESNGLSLMSMNSKKRNVLTISYRFYIEDSTLVLYSLKCSGNSLAPKLDTSIESVLNLEGNIQQLRTAKNKKHTSELYDLLIATESLELMPQLSNLPIFRKEYFNSRLAIDYGTLSWYLIFEKEYSKAVEAAEVGLAKDQQQKWIYTNLALSNLLIGNKIKALEIYNEYKNQSIDKNKTFKEAFIGDLVEAKKANLLDQALYNEILQNLSE